MFQIFLINPNTALITEHSKREGRNGNLLKAYSVLQTFLFTNVLQVGQLRLDNLPEVMQLVVYRAAEGSWS